MLNYQTDFRLLQLNTDLLQLNTGPNGFFPIGFGCVLFDRQRK
jgi:hypothetical protein